MRHRHRVLRGIVVLALIAGLGAAIAQASNGNPPSSAQIADAQLVSDLMVNELVAALFQEFDETTPQNAEHGKKAISLIFNDLNRNMRLIGTFAPLLGGSNDRPSDRFERTALASALTGQASAAVEKVNDTWYYRRSVPLSNTFHQNCVVCHASFTQEFFDSTNNPGQWVGSLVLAVPITSSHGDHDDD